MGFAALNPSYGLGASDDGDAPTRIEGGLQDGTLSMDSYAWSAP